MNATETKRRGRPAKARDDANVADAVEPAEHAESTLDAADAAFSPPRPPCPRCGTPRERSTKLLQAYGMSVLRCLPCHEVAIEGDAATNRYDIETARSGRPPMLATRAAALFAARRSNDPTPTFEDRGFAAAVAEDWDDRWTTLTD